MLLIELLNKMESSERVSIGDTLAHELFNGKADEALEKRQPMLTREVNGLGVFNGKLYITVR